MRRRRRRRRRVLRSRRRRRREIERSRGRSSTRRFFLRNVLGRWTSRQLTLVLLLLLLWDRVQPRIARPISSPVPSCVRHRGRRTTIWSMVQHGRVLNPRVAVLNVELEHSLRDQRPQPIERVHFAVHDKKQGGTESLIPSQLSFIFLRERRKMIEKNIKFTSDLIGSTGDREQDVAALSEHGERAKPGPFEQRYRLPHLFALLLAELLDRQTARQRERQKVESARSPDQEVLVVEDASTQRLLRQSQRRREREEGQSDRLERRRGLCCACRRGGCCRPRVSVPRRRCLFSIAIRRALERNRSAQSCDRPRQSRRSPFRRGRPRGQAR